MGEEGCGVWGRWGFRGRGGNGEGGAWRRWGVREVGRRGGGKWGTTEWGEEMGRGGVRREEVVGRW